MIVASVLVAVFAVAAIAYYALRGLPLTSMPTEPRCGACGYIVLGLESMTCPECGGDLRRVGIDVGQRRGGGGGGRFGWIPGVVAVVAWSVAANVSWHAARDAIERAAPATRSARFSVSFSSPASKSYAQVRADGAGDAALGGSGPAVTSLDLTLITDRGIAGTLRADLATDTYSVATPGGATTAGRKGFGRTAVREWLAAATGGDPAVLAAEADEVADVALASPQTQRGVTRVGGASSSSMSSSGTGGDSGSWSVTDSGRGPFKAVGGTYSATVVRSPAYGVGVPLAALAVWLAGTVLLLRRFVFRRTGRG